MKARRRVHFATIIMWAIVAPFFLLSAVTNGLMPQQTSSGVTVVICTGEGPLELGIDPKTGDPAGDQSTKSHKACDWAGFNLVAHLSAAPLAPVVTTPAPSTAARILPSILAVGRATGLPPSTGPPAII